MEKPFPYDPVIEEYKKDVDRTLLRENLKLTPQERSERLLAMEEFFLEAQRKRTEGASS